MKKWKVTRLRAIAALGLCGWLVPPGAAQGQAIKIQQIRRNVFMLVGDGANITVQTELPVGQENFDGAFGGDVGVLVVDTGTKAMSGELLSVIGKLSSGPIRYIINTSADPDHVGGNEALSKVSGGSVQGALGGRTRGEPLMILAHETVLERMSAPSGKQAVYPLPAWPTDVFTTGKDVFFNGGSTRIMHQPGAYSEGDSLVYLRRSDVIATGEIFSTVNFPKIDASHGGHIQGIVDSLNRLLNLAVPGEKEQGGTMIVPGHGRLSDEADVEFYREMVQIIRDRIQDGVKNGMTLEQVKAARPALEYERRYSQPDWTTDMFVEAVYQDLSQAGKPPASTPSKHATAPVKSDKE
jgi:glyoxylase-like metal-dependent hydrolase (beta-lactamase superfamily II)